MIKYDVTKFGIIGDGKTLNTHNLQNIIDKCNEECILFFPKGAYVLSTIFLKSNIHIEIDKGAVILGSLNFYDYLPDEKVNYPLYQDASHSFFHCSMFVGENCNNISITGEGKIDMRSVWDEDNVRNIVHRGAKCIALKKCTNVLIKGLTINNATDLAVYFAGCENVEICYLKMRVYIDGISPDNSHNVTIYNCDLETGDDGIVFKSSYTLNELGCCKNIFVDNCKIKSRCNAIKFGTETNGAFTNININNIDIKQTRLCGIAIESVDGAIINGVNIKNINMSNVNVPLFIHLGKRMRGPIGRQIGRIENVLIENLKAYGPYEPYEVVAWNYKSYVDKDTFQYPWKIGITEGYNDTKQDISYDIPWQMTCNVCGLKGHKLKNITLRNFDLQLDGGVKEYNKIVPEEAQDYPEVYVYGKILPAKAIYFRHIEGLKLENMSVKTIRQDCRPDFVYEDTTFIN